jgi:nucleoside-diphosphate kinase
MNQTLVLIKPDAFEHKLVGFCVACFEPQIVNLSMRPMTAEICREHYAEHVQKDFYPGLEAHMLSGPVVAMIVNGVDQSRQQALTLRRYWAQYVQGPRNLVHASDSEESALREIQLWFPEHTDAC